MPKSLTLLVESVRDDESIQVVRIGRYKAMDDVSVSRKDLQNLFEDVPRRRYCVTYAPSENGGYLVNVNSDHVYVSDAQHNAASACVLPKSWGGKTVRRKVHPKGHCKWCRKEVD